MSFMVYGASALNGNISSWNRSQVLQISSIFDGASSLNGDSSQWGTRKVISIYSMFAGACALNCNISAWYTSQVVDMDRHVLMATTFRQVLCDISKVASSQQIPQWRVTFAIP